ncbi:MAG TPA: preprotein translocase subunit YajC [Acidimicrobiia bacterium]|nr:preprotein translocase subunit YajC [Acidimicrobiia bacterium]
MQFVVGWVAFMAVLIYLFMWRPQQRRMTAVRALQSALQAGDQVMTTSGIYGRIARLGDSDVDLEIAPGTVIKIARGAIGERLDEATEAG